MLTRVEEEYLDWLYSKVEIEHDDSYWKLMTLLYTTPFDILVPMDENRAEDGIQLRKEFAFECSSTPSMNLIRDEECSFLEMMVGLAAKFSFQIDKSMRSCFWRMITNSGLKAQTDDYFDEEFAIDVVTTINQREFDENGRGGFFPLSSTMDNQQDVELLYQMYAYVNEYYN